MNKFELFLDVLFYGFTEIQNRSERESQWKPSDLTVSTIAVLPIIGIPFFIGQPMDVIVYYLVACFIFLLTIYLCARKYYSGERAERILASEEIANIGWRKKACTFWLIAFQAIVMGTVFLAVIFKYL